MGANPRFAMSASTEDRGVTRKTFDAVNKGPQQRG
jgi:hypothetical protein